MEIKKWRGCLKSHALCQSERSRRMYYAGNKSISAPLNLTRLVIKDFLDSLPIDCMVIRLILLNSSIFSER